MYMSRRLLVPGLLFSPGRSRSLQTCREQRPASCYCSNCCSLDSVMPADQCVSVNADEGLRNPQCER